MADRNAGVRNIIKDTRSLPTLPGIITKLSALAENNKASVNEMARVVSSDHVLSAKVLRLVNSPFYGFSGRVSTISNALILLGVNVVKSLALSSSIFEMMEKNILGLWEHSLGCGVAANIIANRLQIPDVEETATAALLHDIGKVIIKIKLSDEYSEILSTIDDKGIYMIDAERELLGTDHAEIGGILARSWFLPEKLIEPIECHHDVTRSSTQLAKTCVVHVSDALVKCSGFGFSGDDYVPLIQPEAWKKLDLSDALLEEIVAELEDRLVDCRNFSLEIQSGSET